MLRENNINIESKSISSQFSYTYVMNDAAPRSCNTTVYLSDSKRRSLLHPADQWLHNFQTRSSDTRENNGTKVSTIDKVPY